MRWGWKQRAKSRRRRGLCRQRARARRAGGVRGAHRSARPAAGGCAVPERRPPSCRCWRVRLRHPRACADRSLWRSLRSGHSLRSLQRGRPATPEPVGPSVPAGPDVRSMSWPYAGSDGVLEFSASWSLQPCSLRWRWVVWSTHGAEPAGGSASGPAGGRDRTAHGPGRGRRIMKDGGQISQWSHEASIARCSSARTCQPSAPTGPISCGPSRASAIPDNLVAGGGDRPAVLPRDPHGVTGLAVSVEAAERPALLNTELVTELSS